MRAWLTRLLLSRGCWPRWRSGRMPARVRGRNPRARSSAAPDRSRHHGRARGRSSGDRVPRRPRLGRLGVVFGNRRHEPDLRALDGGRQVVRAGASSARRRAITTSRPSPSTRPARCGSPGRRRCAATGISTAACCAAASGRRPSAGRPTRGRTSRRNWRRRKTACCWSGRACARTISTFCIACTRAALGHRKASSPRIPPTIGSPSLAVTRDGAFHVAWDSYRGDYDVMLRTLCANGVGPGDSRRSVAQAGESRHAGRGRSRTGLWMAFEDRAGELGDRFARWRSAAAPRYRARLLSKTASCIARGDAEAALAKAGRRDRACRRPPSPSAAMTRCVCFTASRSTRTGSWSEPRSGAAAGWTKPEPLPYSEGRIDQRIVAAHTGGTSHRCLSGGLVAQHGLRALLRLAGCRRRAPI